MITICHKDDQFYANLLSMVNTGLSECKNSATIISPIVARTYWGSKFYSETVTAQLKIYGRVLLRPRLSKTLSLKKLDSLLFENRKK